MARIPYADPTRPETAALAERIVAERGEILHLYAMLLHSPPVAEGWLTFLTAIRQRCDLPGALRELVIVQVAHLNGARYEAEQHVPIALREGVSRAQLDALPDWRAADVFDPRERAVLAYCDAMTREIHVPPAVFAALRAQCDPRTIVELTATIGAYNMVSRFLEAIGIDSADDISVSKEPSR
ncbi:carboxymuconolactone decarboxylase family protein [Methylobacterium platani]|uniref:Carboxymuconolactone decarboxylase n=2 Tax=Methylobacterium platani TaxID=427683 RepID=A0A179RY71_9HYPH|nr:carboxymuconolactone decarboxylase family protein [Methylobacterium platani]KMO13643.1 carboxymuconolactone decarboxylase [Methylobacterium platani JCM 14648]OAS15870.1 carboxymuconolactone decarboxylase [Methylobacterium platani]